MKLTKGKQKIEMKKVKAYADRMITFSKRRSGIFKKMNEMVSLCDVETAFLVFSETGKPYTFAYPSLEEAFGWLKSPMKHEPAASTTNTKPMVEAYKRQRVKELMKKYVDLVEEMEMKNEKEKVLVKSKKEKSLEKTWWNMSVEKFSVEELKIRHQMFLDLHVSLNAMAKRFGKDSDGSSSGQESRKT